MSVLLLFPVLLLVALVFGTDSRDGHDWTRRPPPLG
jgi:hypothetical protein